MGQVQLKVYRDLGGCLATRPTPLVVDSTSDTRMLSPALKNVSTFVKGALSKRAGRLQQGDKLAGAVFVQQATNDATAHVYGVAGDVLAVAQHFTPPSAGSVVKLDVLMCAGGQNDDSAVTAYIYRADGPGGFSGTLLGTSNTLTAPYYDSPPSTLSFTFGIPVALTCGGPFDTYFIVIATAVLTGGYNVYFKTSAAAANLYSTTSYPPATPNGWTTQAGGLYFKLWANDGPLNGLHDYHSSTTSTQAIMASVGGDLFTHARNATPLTGAWTNLTGSLADLAKGANQLWDFAESSNRLFTTDYGVDIQRCWLLGAAYTIQQGFRATFTATEDTGGALANGTYKIMPVTKLLSGGYRAGAVATLTTTGGKRIKLASIVMNGTAETDFGFEVTLNGTDTTWYMTLAGGSTFYKIPVGNLTNDTVTGNPQANTVTTAYITSLTGLSTSSTLLDNYNLEQGYFTSQIVPPKAKHMAVWNGMLVMAGTGDSKLWFSEANAPNIWSEYGGLQGGFEPINTSDGADINMLYVDGGYLYVGKPNSMFMVTFTQNASAPFAVRQINAKVGCLSHWSCKTLPGGGFALLTSSGPWEVNGTSMRPLPGSEGILDRFNPGNPNSYNLASMNVSTCGINTALKVIKWGVSSHSATTRDLTLVYDYESGGFWEDDASNNFYTEVTDGNYYPSIWGGDYSAFIHQLDTGVNDDGAPIAFYFYTPIMNCGGVTQTTRWKALHIAGKAQSTGTLQVSVYLNQSTAASQVFGVSMVAGSGFDAGIAVPLGLTGKSIQFKFSNAELDVPVQVDSIGLSFEALRESYGTA